MSSHDDAYEGDPERLEGYLFDLVSLLAIFRGVVSHELLGLDYKLADEVGEEKDQGEGEEGLHCSKSLNTKYCKSKLRDIIFKLSMRYEI